MSLRHKSLLLAFIAMLMFTLFSQVISPSFRLIFFAPFLIITYYQRSYLSALNYSLICGLIVDLFTSPVRFGLTALNYTLTTAFIYRQRKNLFADSLMTLPLMTYFFAVISSIIQVILLSIFSKPLSLSFSFFFSEFLIMPAFDALFSFCWFIFPHLFIRKRNHHYHSGA